MQKTKGKNQTLARQINQRLVVSSLLKSEKSCTDLAKEFNLSNTAVAKILKELQDLGLIDIQKSKVETSLELGRRPIMYAVLEKKYMSAVVNLAENQVILFDFCGDIIDTREFGLKSNVFTGKMLDSAIECLCNLVAANNQIMLKSICIVTFGMIDTISGEYVFATRFENSKGLNLVNLFKKKFQDVKISVINDTKLYLLAEQNYGLLQRASNAVLLQIDIGISAAIMLKGETYNGDSGFAGEVGLSRHSGVTLEELVSIEAIKKQVSGELTWNQIAHRYKEGDSEVCKIIDKCAIIISDTIKNIAHMFDCQIVICGRIVELSNKFLNVILREMQDNTFINCKVQFSEIDMKKAWQMGSMKFSIEMGLESILRK